MLSCNKLQHAQLQPYFLWLFGSSVWICSVSCALSTQEQAQEGTRTITKAKANTQTAWLEYLRERRTKMGGAPDNDRHQDKERREEDLDVKHEEDVEDQVPQQQKERCNMTHVEKV